MLTIQNNVVYSNFDSLFKVIKYVGNDEMLEIHNDTIEEHHMFNIDYYHMFKLVNKNIILIFNYTILFDKNCKFNSLVIGNYEHIGRYNTFFHSHMEITFDRLHKIAITKLNTSKNKYTAIENFKSKLSNIDNYIIHSKSKMDNIIEYSKEYKSVRTFYICKGPTVFKTDFNIKKLYAHNKQDNKLKRWKKLV